MLESLFSRSGHSRLTRGWETHRMNQTEWCVSPPPSSSSSSLSLSVWNHFLCKKKNHPPPSGETTEREGDGWAREGRPSEDDLTPKCPLLHKVPPDTRSSQTWRRQLHVIWIWCVDPIGGIFRRGRCWVTAGSWTQVSGAAMSQHLGRRQPAGGRRAARDLENSLNSHRSPPAGPRTDHSVSLRAKGLKHFNFLRCLLASGRTLCIVYMCVCVCVCVC